MKRKPEVRIRNRYFESRRIDLQNKGLSIKQMNKQLDGEWKSILYSAKLRMKTEPSRLMQGCLNEEIRQYRVILHNNQVEEWRKEYNSEPIEKCVCCNSNNSAKDDGLCLECKVGGAK